jgi:acylglycerol lipase
MTSVFVFIGPVCKRSLSKIIHIAVGDGQSEGERVQISDFDIFVRDVVADIFETKKAFPADIPIFILGISMGGAIAVQVGANVTS